MGLPMFREPEEPARQVVAKVDRSSATTRSAIRREPTLRRYNLVVAAQNETSRSNRLLDEFRSRATADDDQSWRRSREGEDEQLHGSSSRMWWVSDDENGMDDLDRRQAGEELLRDALQHHSSPGPRFRLPRPPRESALRFEIAPSPPSSTSRSISAWRSRSFRRQHMPSPPHSLGGSRANQSSPDGPSQSFGDRRVELTPGFPPAQGIHPENVETTQNPGDVARALPDDGYEGSASVAVGTPPPESWEADYPPLRRVGHLSPRPHLASHDGLGDRRRTPSGASSESGAEEDTWETLLTTMEPDEHLPSPDSSFTSASASASTSRRSESASDSANSFRTTTTSFGPDELIVGPLPCDLDDINGSNDELLSEESRQTMAVLREGIRIRRQRRSARAAEPSQERRSRNREDQSLLQDYRRLREFDLLREQNLSLQEERQRAVEESNRDEADRSAAARDAELATMQRFIERMARRIDIPDEFWTGVGLSRIMRENHE